MTTDTSNLYKHVVAKPSVPPPNNGTKAMHATVSTATGASIIGQTAANRHAHNTLVQGASGFKVSGGSKSKRSKSKSFKSKRASPNHSKRTKSKRASSKRYKRGGAAVPTATPTPKPSVVPVPQFAGAHNVGASANSISINHGLMKAGAQAVYDDPNAPASNTKV